MQYYATVSSAGDKETQMGKSACICFSFSLLLFFRILFSLSLCMDMIYVYACGWVSVCMWTSINFPLSSDNIMWLTLDNIEEKDGQVINEVADIVGSGQSVGGVVSQTVGSMDEDDELQVSAC